MLQKIIAYMKQNHMIEAGEHVVAGCSGGADSVCLLLVLAVCRESMGFSLSAVHVEHNIRGEESLRDAAFTEALCGRMQIPLSVCHVDAPAYARQHKIGLEEAARALRFEQFEALGGETEKPVKVALAHHMDDQAETVLFQMIRGSGLSGMCGISPVRRGEKVWYIRPLLCVARAEIEAWLREQNQPFCIDRTNADDAYSRNRIRNVVMPELTAINARAAGHISRNAEKIAQAYSFLCEAAAEAYDRLTVREGGRLCADAPSLCYLHPAVRQEVVRRMIFEAAGHRKDIASVHVEDVIALMGLQSGRRLALPYGVCAYMEYDRLCMEQNGEPGQALEVHITEKALARCYASDVFLPLWEGGNGEALLARGVRAGAPLEEITKKTYTKQFDYDMIKDGFLLRTRKNGDYFVLDADGHRKKLSDFMIDEKVPQRLRGGVRLLAFGSEVFWVIGSRIGQNVKVAAHTARLMEIQYNGGNADGRFDEA